MTLTRHFLVACLLAGMAAPAYAQTPPAAVQPATATAADDPMQQAVQQRIGALQAKLAITAPQMADWNSFTEAMRANAISTNQLFQQRAQNAATMSAVENMKSYAAIARAYADNTDHLATSFATLYAKLSPDQQKTADALFRQPPAPPARGH
jgi:periplasmic protein CpxP/Spy